MERVAFLKGNVSSPVADLDVSLQARYVDERLGEFITHPDRLNCSRSHLAERAICKFRAFFLGKFGSGFGSGNDGILRDLCGSKFNFRLLLRCNVC